MWVLVCVAHLWICFSLNSLGKERPAKTNLMPANLRAVLACGKSNSAQCWSLLDFRKINFLIPHIVSKFFISAILIFLTPRSVNQPAQSLTPCSVSLPAWSHLFREYLCENKFLRKTILACLSVAQVGCFQNIK